MASRQSGGSGEAVAGLPHTQRPGRRARSAAPAARWSGLGSRRSRWENDTTCGVFSNNRSHRGERQTMRVLITGATGTIGLALADALTRARRPGRRAVPGSRAGTARAGRRGGGPRVARPRERAAAGRGARRSRRGRQPAGRAGGAALDRRRQAAHPRVARAGDPRWCRGAQGAAARRPSAGRWSRSRRPATTGRAAMLRSTSRPRPADDFLAEVTVAWEHEACCRRAR